MKDHKVTGAAAAILLLTIVLGTQFLQHFSSIEGSGRFTQSFSRQKRLIFLSADRQFSLPPGTIFSMTFTFSLSPFLRELPTGYSSDLIISVPFIVSFDSLLWTTSDNPWGLWPDFSGTVFRKKRDTWGSLPVIDWSGGDRGVLYQVIEDTLENMGYEGGPCLQRAICEYFQQPLENHGFFGELIELLFSASSYPDARIHLKEHLLAEITGRTSKNCEDFIQRCSHSVFLNSSHNHETRQKRFIYLTPEQRLTFPPGTQILLNLRLDLPGFRLMPVGLGSSFAISMPLSVSMDSLGLTTEDHPFGNLTLLTGGLRKKREAIEAVDKINWAGGDREIMYMAVENTLNNFGMNGKACLLRATCEMFQVPMDRYGVIGEVMELFFSASRSPYANVRLEEYLEAEERGRTSGDCVPYHQSCPHSIFSQTKYHSLYPVNSGDAKHHIDPRHLNDLL